MNEKVFGTKSTLTPKIFGVVYLVLVLFLFYTLFLFNIVASVSVIVILLLLRVLYEFLMSSFKSTEHLYRIAELLDKRNS
ncbi:hypothetical protein WM46_03310 [Citrobacter freundii complex sp. CFNIH2]|nr:hypothetical protein WM46_03310 [Citrobacter freundii complex sp. CFNIH2]